MSVKDNTIRGKIDSSMCTIPVFRFNYKGFLMYGSWYRNVSTGFTAIGLDNGFDVDDDKLEICAAKVKWSNGTVKLSIAPISDFNSDLEIAAQFTPISVTSDSKLRLSNVESIINLNPSGQSGDNKALYAGVWYKPLNMTSDIKFKVMKPDLYSNGYPGIPDSFTESDVEWLPGHVTFIPFSTSLSIFSGSKCVSVNSFNEFYKRFTAWVKSAYGGEQEMYEQVNCERSVLDESGLLDPPLNCLFTGLTCNSNSGYNYCLEKEKCGECFGKCDQKQRCIKETDSRVNNFVCESTNFNNGIKKNIDVKDSNPLDKKIVNVDGKLDENDVSPNTEGVINAKEEDNDDIFSITSIIIAIVIIIVLLGASWGIYYFMNKNEPEPNSFINPNNTINPINPNNPLQSQ